MATRYPSDYDNRGRVEPGISRSSAPRSGVSRSGYSGQRPSSSRSGAPRSGYSDRRPASGQRPAQRPSSRGPAPRSGYSGQRPPQPRRGGPRRRKPNYTPIFAALAVVLVLVIVFAVVKPFGRPTKDPVANPPAVPASNTVTNTASDTSSAASNNALLQAESEGEPAVEYDNIADKLADSDYDVGSLSAEDMAQVSDLMINTSLPSEWMNVLLLGTDERTLSDSARTDAMLICSINRNTGEVKLASIMRDLAIEYNDIGKYSGTYRINAANFFGGPKLAMRTINEKFGMNIQYYVMVNFFGFQKIAQRVGGVEIDITEAEKDKINKMIVKQAKVAYQNGIDESDQENVYLETYGENTHLNGRQTLAYARIRKLTGGDAMRTERQRIVLEKLLAKVKKLDAIQLAALATDMIDQVKTNLPFDDIFAIAMQVCGNGISDIKSMHLPVSGTYKEESRNDQSMLYDCDFKANALALYNFIYEN